MDDREIRPPSLIALPSFLAGNVARIGHRLLLGALAEHDLRLPHAAIMAALSDFGPLAQYQIAERLDIQRSHLVGYVDLLEARGLVQRERDPEDRRRQNVALTRPDERSGDACNAPPSAPRRNSSTFCPSRSARRCARCSTAS